MSQQSLRPKARVEDLVSEEVGDELVVFDQRTQKFTRLNRSAAAVWRACDGTRRVDELLAAIRPEIGEVADEDLVTVALDMLTAAGLLEPGTPVRSPREARESRRRFIRRVGTVGVASAALPLVHAIAAPQPAQAASGGGSCICGTCICDGTCVCSCGLCICYCICYCN